MIAKALLRLVPNAEFTIDGDTYDGITWIKKPTKIPTKKEVEIEIIKVQADLKVQDFNERRIIMYQLKSDPLFFEYNYLKETNALAKDVSAARERWLDAVNKIKVEVKK